MTMNLIRNFKGDPLSNDLRMTIVVAIRCNKSHLVTTFSIVSSHV
jgi:hypothetical protein